MTTLRNFIDGDGSLMLNIDPVKTKSAGLGVNDEVIIRRKMNRSGPATNQVLVGKILAMAGTKATVSVPEAGSHKRIEVDVSELSPVTASFRRSSMQLNRAFRPSV